MNNKIFRKYLCKFLFVALIYSISNLSYGSSTNTLEIAKDSAEAALQNPASNCLNYKVLGLCFWEEYEIVSTTPYVEHYLPDVVVSVFNNPGDNAWTEESATLDEAGKVVEQEAVSSLSGGVDAGGGQHSMSDEHEQQVKFKEVDVVGNPGLIEFGSHLGYLLLQSTAAPGVPYFQSMADAPMWRGFPPGDLAEEAFALLNLNRFLGKNLTDNWGPVLPIQGKLFQPNDTKASAVIAQRALNLITWNNPYADVHVHKSLNSGTDSCGQHCDSDAFKEDDPGTKFQLVSPVSQTTCDTLENTMDPSQGLDAKANGSYTMIVWRHYKGCIQGPGKYIGHT